MVCNRCPLAIFNSFKTVKPRGDITKKLFIIGEAPGYKEQKVGYAFVGKAGEYLQYFINSNGLKSVVYLTNAIKCRPPKNRKPTLKELQTCRPKLLNELAAAKPSIVILLGNTAINSFYNMELNSITKLKDVVIKSGNTIILFNYHPAYILRNPELEVEYDKFFAKVRVLYKYFVNKYV